VLPGGGPGWLELDFDDGAGPGWVSLLSSREGGFRSVIADPSCQLSLNGDPPVAIDFLASERADKVLEPVRVARRPQPDRARAQPRRARALLGRGCSIPRAVPKHARSESNAFGVLGRSVAGAAPSKVPETAETFLEAQPERSAAAEALLGVVQFSDRRFAQGIAHLQKAVATDPKDVGARMFLAEAYNRGSYLPDTWRRGRAREVDRADLGRAAGRTCACRSRTRTSWRPRIARKRRSPSCLRSAKRIRLRPSSARALESLSAPRHGGGDGARALRRSRDRAARSRRPAALRELLGERRPAGARARRTHAARAQRWDVSTLQGHGDRRRALGRVDEAVANFRKASALSERAEDLERSATTWSRSNATTRPSRS
jgi:tetratricopeptide (TPR) repeat protein